MKYIDVNNGDWDTGIIADPWDDELDLLAGFGLEFKGFNWGGDNDTEGDGGETGKKSKKTKAKKIIECPHCKKEIEI
jgi:hypothetical protein